MSKTIDEAVSGHPAAEAELEQLRNRVGQLQDQVGGDGRVVNSDKMREAIKGWLDANVHDGEDRSGASDVAYFTPDELQELVEECLEAVAVQRPVAEVIPNTVGVEMAWIDPRNKPPVGAKLYTLAQQPESDPRDGCELECGTYGTYCRCKDRAAYERQAQQPESEPVPFEVGGHYRTQVGKWVKFVKVHNQGTRHETMADENGVHRYTNRPGDMGRVTGTAHDYSDWRNTPPTYASPQPSAQIPSEQGKNRYGLDMSYFRNLINRELNRPLTDFRPDEFARVCARMAATADREVLQESEFGRKQPSPQVPEGLLEACREVQEFDRTAQYPSDGHIAARIIKDYGNWPKGSAKGHAAGDIADEAVAYVCSLTAAPSIAEKREPIKLKDRLPTKDDEDCEGRVWLFWDESYGDDRVTRATVEYVRSWYPHPDMLAWMPTGLQRPEPPEVSDEN